MVHEFGHTLGLQHTLASSVMSTHEYQRVVQGQPARSGRHRGHFPALSGRQLFVDGGQHLGHREPERERRESGVGGCDFAQQSRPLPRSPTRTAPIRSTACRREQYYVYVHPLPPPVEGESSPDNVFPPKNSNGHLSSAQHRIRHAVLSRHAAITRKRRPINVTAGKVYPSADQFQCHPREFARRGFRANV